MECIISLNQFVIVAPLNRIIFLKNDFQMGDQGQIECENERSFNSISAFAF